MTPWFVLSYPRSRTAWLSVYLTGCGVPCFHEAWKLADTPAAMRTLMEQQQAPVVCNSDCSNVFFFDAILADFPNARFLRIKNDRQTVLDSLKASHGDHDYTAMMAAYESAFRHVEQSDVSMLTVECKWWDLGCSRWIVERMTGSLPPDWWADQMEGLLVQMMPNAIAGDIASAQRGEFAHIARQMTEDTSWV